MYFLFVPEILDLRIALEHSAHSVFGMLREEINLK